MNHESDDAEGTEQHNIDQQRQQEYKDTKGHHTPLPLTCIYF